MIYFDPVDAVLFRNRDLHSILPEQKDSYLEQHFLLGFVAFHLWQQRHEISSQKFVLLTVSNFPEKPNISFSVLRELSKITKSPAEALAPLWENAPANTLILPAKLYHRLFARIRWRALGSGLEHFLEPNYFLNLAENGHFSEIPAEANLPAPPLNPWLGIDLKAIPLELMLDVYPELKRSGLFGKPSFWQPDESFHAV